MKRQRLYLSTIDPSAGETARKYGLGIEIAQFCTAVNMDEGFAQTDTQVQRELAGIDRCVFHCPFNELFPCAIDPKARVLAMARYRQASNLAARYGARKTIFHAGFVPNVYFPVWFTEQSVTFWKEFLGEQPQTCVFCLENVMESDPQWLKEIVQGVDDPRLGICLDVGHANVCSRMDVFSWLETLAPWIRHFHIHNNDGTWDTHSPLGQGSIPMENFLTEAASLCSAASFTLEVSDAQGEVSWLLEHEQLED